jgi:dihydroorotate dehydrogenase (fumarate)
MTLDIHPPLLNSPCPWATTLEDLRKLYSSPHTGAVTTRTNTLNGFPHNDFVHQYTFFNPETLECASDAADVEDKTGSLNTLGYSPYTLDETLENVRIISEEAGRKGWRTDKPFFCSVTGTEEEVERCYEKIARLRERVTMDLYMEVNLSCPNIAGIWMQNPIVRSRSS